MAYQQRSPAGLPIDPLRDTGPRAGAPGKATLVERIPQRLPEPLRARAERTFGPEVSDVRLQESAEADAAGALAFTRGMDISFRPGGLDPERLESEEGLELLGHELAHAMQQRRGVRATQAKAAPGGQPANLDPSLEAEADEGGRRFARGERMALATPAGGPPAPAAPVTQFKLRHYDDIKTKGNGFDWDPHRTQDTSTGATDDERIAFGLGTDVKGTATLQIPWGGRVTSTRDPATKEPSTLEWQLHPRVTPGPAPDSASWKRVQALMDAADKTHNAYPYEASMLVPDGLGGDDAKDNVVVLPDESHQALGLVHERLYRLVGQQNACVLFKATVTHADDPAGAKQRYAQSIRCEWHEIDPTGTLVAGTQGELTINVRSPTDIGGGLNGSVDTPATIGGVHGPANRALLAPNTLDRDAKTAVSWQTEIEWSPTNNEGDGVKMEARKLGPDHMMGEEPDSKAGLVWADRVKEMESLSSPKKTYVAGHLLNHQLGGPGNDARNLAPIPSDSNTKFERDVESAVKRIVNVEHGWAYYMVEVNHTKVKTTTYPSAVRALWWQLDALGDEVPNTRGDVTMDLDAPTAGGAYGVTTTQLDGGADSRQGGTATSAIAFNELLLDNDPAILRPKILVMRPLVRSLEELALNPLFREGNLLESAEEIVAGVAPSAAELAAYKELSDFSDELGKVGSPRDIEPKRMDEVMTALATAISERRLRTQSGLDAADLFYRTRYDDKRAAHISAHLKDAMMNADADAEKLQRLGLDMLSHAKALHGVTEEIHGKLAMQANAFREWLGMAPLDPKKTSHEDADKEITAHSKEVVGNVNDIYTLPASPMQVMTYGGLEGISTADNAVDMRQALGNQAVDPLQKKNKAPAYGSVAPQKLGEKMLAILEDDAQRDALVKLAWTGGPNEAEATVTNLAKMIALSKPMGIDWKTVAQHTIRDVYERHTIPFEKYYRWVESNI